MEHKKNNDVLYFTYHLLLGLALSRWKPVISLMVQYTSIITSFISDLDCLMFKGEIM